MKLSRLVNYFAIVLLVSACSTAKKTPPQSPVPSSPSDTRREGTLLKKDYEGFTLWLDCKERAAVKFRYNAQRDTGNEPRRENFSFDPDVPRECQQTSTKGYGNNYDRGHQVPANHLDYSAVAIKQSNYMSNILPQAAGMNRGAWLLTEEIIECYRDIDELLVLGGVIWGNNTSNDYFVDSHGVRTPDAFWKVVIRGKEDVIAWIIPNSSEAKRDNLDNYLTTVANIEKATGEKIPVTGDARTKKVRYSWIVPIGCNKN
jgi:endonuclease G, mitochondrial